MPEQALKFTAYNDGEHGVVVGHGDAPAAGQQIKKRLEFYSIEEVTVSKGGLWIASVKRNKEGEQLCGRF